MAESKITKSARGQDCQVRLPFICNHDSSTVVFAHVRLKGQGANIKEDLLGAYTCSACHDVVDQRKMNVDLEPFQIFLYFYEGCFRTLLMLEDQGLIERK